MPCLRTQHRNIGPILRGEKHDISLIILLQARFETARQAATLALYYWRLNTNFTPSKHEIGYPSVGFILAHRLRHWPNIKPTLGQRLLFAMPAVCDVGPTLNQQIIGSTSHV